MYISALKLLLPALKENKRLTTLVISGTILMITLSVGFNKWRSFFYDNVQKYNEHNIYLGLGIFCILALLFVFIYGLSSYFTRHLEFKTREYLYNKLSLIAQQKHNSGVQNVEQRIQDDSLRFAKTSIALLKAILDSTVRLPVFLYILAAVAAPWMLLIVLIYAILGTLLSKKVASKLINAEYNQESLEAALRRDVIASLNEQKTLPTLKQIMLNWNELALRQKSLSYYTSFYSQISVIFPFIMLMPMFLSKSITLGVLFATSAAIEQVLGSLSVFVESRDLVVDLNMVTRRLKEME